MQNTSEKNQATFLKAAELFKEGLNFKAQHDHLNAHFRFEETLEQLQIEFNDSAVTIQHRIVEDALKVIDEYKGMCLNSLKQENEVQFFQKSKLNKQQINYLLNVKLPELEIRWMDYKNTFLVNSQSKNKCIII